MRAQLVSSTALHHSLQLAARPPMHCQLLRQQVRQLVPPPKQLLWTANQTPETLPKKIHPCTDGTREIAHLMLLLLAP